MLGRAWEVKRMILEKVVEVLVNRSAPLTVGFF